MTRIVRRTLIILMTLAWTAGAALAYINPTFTPVEMVQESDSIVEMRIGPPDDTGNTQVQIVEVLKGQPEVDLANLRFKRSVIAEVRREVFTPRLESALAIAFTSTMTGEGGERFVLGNVSLQGGHWFNLYLDPATRTWIVESDPQREWAAVWDGRTDMLRRLVSYILTSPDPDVPVAIESNWADPIQLGRTISRPEPTSNRADIQAVDLRGDGRLALFVADASGDCLFEVTDDGKFVETSEERTLTTASLAATFGDFDGDGHLDLASWDGQHISILRQSAEGRLARTADGFEMTAPCYGLSTVDIGPGAETGLVVSSQGAPRLLVPNAEGRFEIRPLVPSAAWDENTVSSVPCECAVADFDGDGFPDVAQPLRNVVAFYKGTGRGQFAPPIITNDLGGFQEPSGICTGDFDADGHLDLLLTGASRRPVHWGYAGNGRFEGRYHVGEPDYIAHRYSIDCSAGDLDNDGRQDYVIVYENGTPQMFFNRGFSTFGFVRSLDLSSTLERSGEGAQTGVLADVNGDGAQDFAFVLKDGTIWVLLQRLGNTRALCVNAALKIGADFGGPLSVTGWSLERCLGARQVWPGGAPAVFGRARPGPIRLTWRFPHHGVRERTIITTRGPVRTILSPDGTHQSEMN